MTELRKTVGLSWNAESICTIRIGQAGCTKWELGSLVLALEACLLEIASDEAGRALKLGLLYSTMFSNA